MCFQFVHPCSDPLLKQLAALIGQAHYFLICIGNLNYFYSNDPGAAAILKGLLLIDHITLHALTAGDMQSVINAGNTMDYQVFHGNRTLLEVFLKQPVI